MAAGRETRLWRWLAEARKVHREKLHMTRVENAVSAGMTDVEGCYDGTQFWMELKCEARPKNADTRIKPRFQPAQVPWIERRVRAGGQAFVLLQVGQGALSSRYLVPGNEIATLARGMTEAELDAASAIPPKSLAAGVIVAATISLPLYGRAEDQSSLRGANSPGRSIP